MKAKLIIFLCIIFQISGLAQLDCPEKFEMRVIAKSGLNMRAEPSIRSKVVTTVPYDSTLMSCTATAGELQVDKIKGHWRQSEYQGLVGYMFDGFLEVVDLKPKEADSKTGIKQQQDSLLNEQHELKAGTPKDLKPGKAKETTRRKREFQFLTETYNYCGDVDQINPGLLWYGFYPPEEGEDDIRIKPVEVEVVLSKARTSKNLEFDIQTDQNERSIFLIGTNTKLDMEAIDRDNPDELLRYSDRKVYPGQQLTLGKGRKALRLAATGSVKSSGDCPTLENYELVLEGETKQVLSPLLPSGQCGMPEIYWFGDFTGDGIPEIIFVSVYKTKNIFTLLVSENTGQSQVLKKAAEWSVEKCK